MQLLRLRVHLLCIYSCSIEESWVYGNMVATAPTSACKVW